MKKIPQPEVGLNLHLFCDFHENVFRKLSIYITLQYTNTGYTVGLLAFNFVMPLQTLQLIEIIRHKLIFFEKILRVRTRGI